jgi:hypothetical protein
MPAGGERMHGPRLVEEPCRHASPAPPSGRCRHRRAKLQVPVAGSRAEGHVPRREHLEFRMSRRRSHS